MTGNYKDNANVFKAISDENRLKILALLLENEKCGSELLESLSVGQSTLSHHLKLMCVSGIIKSRKSGTATFYSINPDGAKNAVKLLAELTGVVYESNASSPKNIKEGETEKSTVIQKGSRPNGWLL